MHVENSKNLGDNLLQLNFMRKACLEHPDLELDYYCNVDYHAQLAQFIDGELQNRIRLHSHAEAPPDAIDSWIAGKTMPGYYWNHPKRHVYNEFYYEWFQHLAGKMGIRSPIKSPVDVAFDHPLFDDYSLIGPELLRYYDVLVIDCDPKSGQFCFDRQMWEDAKARWRAKCRVLSVHDTKLTLAQIGLMARLSGTVVSVCTGPLHVAFNKLSIASVTKWYIFHNAHTYSYCDNIVAMRRNEDLLKINF